MTQTAGVAAEGRWADHVSLGVLASSVPRDVIDDAVAAVGKQAKRSDGKLPPHVMVYFAMAMALFAEDDYEEVGARLAGTLPLRVWIEYSQSIRSVITVGICGYADTVTPGSLP